MLCKGCGSEFFNKKSNVKYCSYVCRKKIEKVRLRKWLVENGKAPKNELKNTKKTCVVCNTGFIPKVHNAKYCSKNCQKEYWNKERCAKEFYKMRFDILERDGFRCSYCGANPRVNKMVRLHIDHIKPREKGGGNEYANLTTACQACNLGKTNTFYPEIFNKIT